MDVLNTHTFILLTAESEVHQVQEAVRAGVSGYIVKPFTSQGLREKIESCMKVKGP